jgi:uncharacterized protein YbjT (DUF2867 family)
VSNDKNKELAAQGAKIRAFDVNSTEAPSALQDIDVLISTTGFAGIRLQTKLVEVAHAANVKLFVPAEWGDVTDGREEPAFLYKQSVRADAAKLGLPTVAFFTGFWTEFITGIGYDLQGGKIAINGSGEAQLSTTSVDDIARFVAYVLTNLPKERLENAKFTLQGDVIVSIHMFRAT